MDRQLYLPSLSHWTYGNLWSGDRKGVRYFITSTGSEMTAEVWDEDICHELASIRTSAVFPATEEGVEEMRRWLVDQTGG